MASRSMLVDDVVHGHGADPWVLVLQRHLLPESPMVAKLGMASDLVRDSRQVERMDLSLTWADGFEANVDSSYSYVVR